MHPFLTEMRISAYAKVHTNTNLLRFSVQHKMMQDMKIYLTILLLGALSLRKFRRDSENILFAMQDYPPHFIYREV